MTVEEGQSEKQAAREVLRSGPASPQNSIDAAKSGLAPLAHHGDAEAQNLLGAIELELVGDYQEARRWFEMAAAQDDPAGQRGLGHLYAVGRGVPKDTDRAVELFRLAAAAGDAYAMFNLAAANLQAEGQYLSLEETIELLASAADQGIREARPRLGDLLAANDRDAEALAQYVRAASAGHLGSMNAAACRFRDGTAGEVDLVQAARWFMTMLQYGNGDGVHEIFQFASRMTTDEIREAASLAGDPQAAESFIKVLTNRRQNS